MVTNRTVVMAENGVVLIEVTLVDGVFEIETWYVVRTRRTASVLDFDDREAAEQAFRDEVQRCRAA